MSQPLHELFLASCGVFGSWNLSVYGPKKVLKEHTLTVPYVLVGSRDDTCLRLKHPEVSRRHAYLQALPGGLFCVDLGSRTGLRFNDVDRMWGWLRTGQRLAIGPYTLELPAANQTAWLASSAWAPDDPIVDHADDNAPLAPVIGTLSDSGKVIAEWRMKRVIALVGRSQRCLISVGHTSLSRLHCSLVRTPLGLWVVDLLSRTGTYLNGKAVRCARLREGDRLQVGKYVLRFWYQQPRPKIVVPIATHSEILPDADAVPAPAAEVNRALSVPAKGRATMLQTERLPPPPTAVAETNTARALVADNLDPASAERSLVLALVGQFDLMQQQMFGQFQESLLMATRLFASLHQEQMAAIHQELAELQGLAGELRALQDELTKTVAGNAPRAVKPIKNGARESPPTKTEDLPSSVESTSGKPRNEEAAPAPAAPPAQGEDVHDWLTQRIAALETEQKSRWSKLLGMVLGR